MSRDCLSPIQANPVVFCMHPLYHHVKRFWRHYCGTDVIDSCEVSTSLKKARPLCQCEELHDKQHTLYSHIHIGHC